MFTARTVLAVMAVGCQAASWILAAQEVVASPIPWLAQFSTIVCLVTWWLIQRTRTEDLSWAPGPSLVAAIIAVWLWTEAVRVRALGLHGLAFVLQAIAFTAFVLFVFVDHLTVVRPGWRWVASRRRAIGSALACVLAVVALIMVANPISTRASALEDPANVLVAGDVTVSWDGDAVGYQGPHGAWTYRHAGSVAGRWPNTLYEEPTIVVSPNGEFVAASFLVDMSQDPEVTEYVWQHVVVLEAATGKVIVESSSSSFVNVALTNQVALVDRQAYSLPDGQPLWTRDDIPRDFPSMPGTSTQFIIDYRCDKDEDRILICRVDLLPDSGGEIISIDAVMGDESCSSAHKTAPDFVIADGWVLRRRDPVVPYDKDGSRYVGAEAVAYHLETGEEIPVGAASGADRSRPGLLGICPALTNDDRLPATTTWFNPATRKVEG